MLPYIHGISEQHPIVYTVLDVEFEEVSFNLKAIWRNMLRRCYVPSVQEKYPTYMGCTVSDTFKVYTHFQDWYFDQFGYAIKGWQIDKDLLIKGNKLYSEDTCILLPKEINMALINRKAKRGCLPVGVSASKTKGKYISQLSLEGRIYYLGTFSTAEQAFLAYKQVKEAHLSDLAERYKILLDPRAYHALKNYQVEITD